MTRPKSCQDCEKQSVCEIHSTILRNAKRAFAAKEALKGTESALHKDLSRCIARHCLQVAETTPKPSVGERSTRTGSLHRKQHRSA
jgi:hypothetical protein